MAKRIKVKGKNPRGFSKAQRIILNASSKRANAGSTLTRDQNRNWSNTREQMEKAGKDVSSRPSSTVKKLVKEGNPKFIGPRTVRSELAEYRKAVAEPGEYAYRRGRKKVRGGEDESQGIGVNLSLIHI